MHSLVHSLQVITESMVAQLDDVTEEQIIFFIDQREQLVQQLQQIDITEADKQEYGSIIQGVLQHDNVITSKLEELRSGASDDIQKVSVARVQNTAYSAPYVQDSYYFDKKK
jgi:uncharacterized protein YjfI (DUF2170 family)